MPRIKSTQSVNSSIQLKVTVFFLTSLHQDPDQCKVLFLQKPKSFVRMKTPLSVDPMTLKREVNIGDSAVV